MITVKRLTDLLADHDPGWAHVEDPGFITFVRTDPDGRRQALRFFQWGNVKYADAEGIPRAYMVVCPVLEAVGSHLVEDARLRIPYVKWPATGDEQVKRPWAEVRSEFEEVFLPIMDCPTDQGLPALERMGDRYRITAPDIYGRRSA